MCLLVLAWRRHTRYPLYFAGNRDEFHDRPTAAAGWWRQPADLLAGRDLQAGGTWLGITRAGRFAVVTNFRELGERLPDAPSRGGLIVDFADPARELHGFSDALRAHAHEYAGFNLLFGDTFGSNPELHYYTNRGSEITPLPSGIHGLSNHQLDTPWPKLARTRARFEQLLTDPEPEPEAMFEVLADRRAAGPGELPDTGLPPELERALSAPFVVSPRYGTRCSTIVRIDVHGKVDFFERSFGAAGDLIGEQRHTFSLRAAEHTPR